MKLIMENWRGFLSENNPNPVATQMQGALEERPEKLEIEDTVEEAIKIIKPVLNPEIIDGLVDLHDYVVDIALDKFIELVDTVPQDIEKFVITKIQDFLNNRYDLNLKLPKSLDQLRAAYEKIKKLPGEYIEGVTGSADPSTTDILMLPLKASMRAEIHNFFQEQLEIFLPQDKKGEYAELYNLRNWEINKEHFVQLAQAISPEPNPEGSRGRFEGNVIKMRQEIVDLTIDRLIDTLKQIPDFFSGVKKLEKKDFEAIINSALSLREADDQRMTFLEKIRLVKEKYNDINSYVTFTSKILYYSGLIDSKTLGKIEKHQDKIPGLIKLTILSIRMGELVLSSIFYLCIVISLILFKMTVVGIVALASAGSTPAGLLAAIAIIGLSRELLRRSLQDEATKIIGSRQLFLQDRVFPEQDTIEKGPEYLASDLTKAIGPDTLDSWKEISQSYADMDQEVPEVIKRQFLKYHTPKQLGLQ